METGQMDLVSPASGNRLGTVRRRRAVHATVYSNIRHGVIPLLAMQSTHEAFSRVIIDSQLTAQGWSLADGFSVRYEVVLEDGIRCHQNLLATLCETNNGWQ